jgi:hypothetical protein
MGEVNRTEPTAFVPDAADGCWAGRRDPGPESRPLRKTTHITRLSPRQVHDRSRRPHPGSDTPAITNSDRLDGITELAAANALSARKIRSGGPAELRPSLDLLRTAVAHFEGSPRRRLAPAERPKRSWEVPTSSELAVVEAITSGMTNREAGAHLFLSPHTVIRLERPPLAVASRCPESIAS